MVLKDGRTLDLGPKELVRIEVTKTATDEAQARGA
jgi:hypothetical protein